MRINHYTALIVAGILALATLAPSPTEAGWGGKATSTYRASAADESAPAKPPLPLVMVVPQNNDQQVCLTSTKSWAQTKGRVQGKAGGVFRENASGVLVKIQGFTVKKKKYVDGVAVRCKDLGPLLKGDLVEITPKFSSLQKTDVAGDKLVVTLSQAPAP